MKQPTLKYFVKKAFETNDFHCSKTGNTYKKVTFNNGWGACKIVQNDYKGQVLASDEQRKCGYFLFQLGKHKYPCCYNDERIVKFN